MRKGQVLVLLGYLLLGALPGGAQEDDPDKKLKSAEGLFKQGAFADAEKVLLTIEQPSAKMLQLLGQAQVKLKKFESALKTYERYVEKETIGSKKAAGQHLVDELRSLTATRFKITSFPPGATVYIDSKVDGPVGKTPISTMVTPGQHRVMLELAGHNPIKVNVSAVEQQEIELPFSLLPMGCDLKVTSVPEKAKVFIDGKDAGATPVSRHLRAGLYRVEVILKAGEPPVLRQISCDYNDAKPIVLHLTPESDAPQPAPASPAPQPPPAPVERPGK